VSLTVQNIADQVQCTYSGDGNRIIKGIAPIESAQKEHITFLANPRYEKLLASTSAGCIIISPQQAESREGTFLLAKNPYYIFARVSQLFQKPIQTPQGISPQAFIEEDVEIGENPSIFPLVYISRGARIGDRVTLYPNVFLGQNCRVGDDTLIYPNVAVREEVTIGKRVIIHSGTVIGSDGFGFAPDQGIHHKIPQIGEVIVEDDVELGASVTIDRGTIGSTRIGKGTKFDNQVHLAHNVTIGENSLIAAQSGVSGSTKVGNSVTIAGQCGLVGHINVGDNVVVGGKSNVLKSVKPGKIVSGILPARDHSKAKRSIAALARLPDLFSRVRKIEKILRDKGMVE